jgi:hypothetical protein
MGKQKGFLVAPAGSGKTFAILGLYNILKKLNKIKGKLLIVTTLKGLKSYRKVEKEKVYNLSFSFWDSSNKAEFPIKQDDIDVVVISNSVFPELKFNNTSFSLIGIDEIQAYRNGKTNLVTAMREFLKGYDGRLVGISATPFHSRLEDAYHLFALFGIWVFGTWDNFFEKYVDYDLIPNRKYWNGFKAYALKSGRKCTYKNFSVYAREICHVLDPFIKKRLSYKNLDDFTNKISPYMFIKKDHSFSCNIQIKNYSIDVSKYENYLDMIQQIRDEEEKNILPYLVKLQKMFSCDDTKKETLLKTLQDNPGGYLIYFNFIETQSRINNYLKENGYNPVVLNGGTKGLEEIVEKLTGNEIVLISPVGGQSMDFYFQNAIVYESFYVPGALIQFLGRMTRYNADYSTVKLTFLISLNTVEEYFYLRCWELLQATSTSTFFTLPLTRSEKELERFREEKGRVSFGLLKEILLWRE